MTTQTYGKVRCNPCNMEVSGLLRDLDCPRCTRKMQPVGPLEIKDDGVDANADKPPTPGPN